MRLIPSDPDIRTLIARIDEKSIDLQPDFQRGVVWTREKRQRLIDSILRDWHVPPVHLVVRNDNQVVLDGQQRLATIHAFFHNEIRVDGNLEPVSPELRPLHGFTFANLPERLRSRFLRFTIRVFEIIDYKPEEPYELFYRLNQPTPLTSAERRNAFFGPARAQVRELVMKAAEQGLTHELIGFSNARMAYDDAIARFCIAVERDTLRTRISSLDITQKYRSGEPFARDVVLQVSRSLEVVCGVGHVTGERLRLNKATLHSWLCAIVHAVKHGSAHDSRAFVEFVPAFEKLREATRRSLDPDLPLDDRFDRAIYPHAFRLLQSFTDRASSRANDVSSVVLRDAIIWLFLAAFKPARGLRVPNLKRGQSALSALPLHGRRSHYHELFDQIEYSSWGEFL